MAKRLKFIKILVLLIISLQGLYAQKSHQDAPGTAPVPPPDTLYRMLTGGVNGPKTWRMDIDSLGDCYYFDGPLFFSGYSDGNGRTEWAYWAWDVLPGQLPYTVNGVEQLSYFNWTPDYAGNTWIMSAQNYGTITFNGFDMSVITNKFGVVGSGTFTLNSGTMKLAINDCIIPIDTFRINDEQFLPDNLHNLRIFSLTDSTMQIGIKRSFEGGDLSEWTLVYNFIAEGNKFTLPDRYIYTEPIKASFTQDDLVGTWKYAPDAQNWIAWKAVNSKTNDTVEANKLGSWTDREEMVTTLVSWGAANADSIFSANDSNEFVFNDDGTCVLANDSNTYTVTNGAITFDTPLSTEFACVYMDITGEYTNIIDVKWNSDSSDYVDDGTIWLGQHNGDKYESKAVHLYRVEPENISDNIQNAVCLTFFPNPVADHVTMQFKAKGDTQATAILYDISGKQIASIYDGNAHAGFNFVKFNVSEYSRGVYIVELQIDGESRYNKLIIQ